MHEFRTAILTGDVKNALDPVSRKEACRRQRSEGPSLIALSIPRSERRTTDQRREDRFQDTRGRATVVFRGKKTLVRVVNVSSVGVMIESAIMPNIGEKIVLELDGRGRVEGVVRWIRQGRMGLEMEQGSPEPR